jgi:hypothetical protein
MKKVLNFFRNRSILFYIFWSSFWIGPVVHLTILRECSGTLFRRDHIVARYASQIINCNPVTRPFFVDICEYIMVSLKRNSKLELVKQLEDEVERPPSINQDKQKTLKSVVVSFQPSLHVHDVFI